MEITSYQKKDKKLNNRSNILIENNETHSSTDFTRKSKKENSYSKRRNEALLNDDEKLNINDSSRRKKDLRNKNKAEITRNPRQPQNITQRNSSKRIENKYSHDRNGNGNLITYNSQDNLDKFLNENYKTVNLKKEYTESFLKRNNDSYSKTNISMSKKTSNEKTPRDMNISGHKQLSSREREKRENKVNAKRSKKLSISGKIKRISNLPKDNLNKSNLLNTSKHSSSSVSYYLDRRHMQTMEKINYMRSEQLKTEFNELKEKPQLSKNSMVIAQRLGKSNVFDRLTCESQGRRRKDELNLIERNSSKNIDKPRINDSSQLLTRTIDDLLTWKKKVEMKKESKYEEEINKIRANPKLESSSEKILKNRAPSYLKTKVEDRLIGKGNLYKLKAEENKKNYYDRIIKTPQHKIIQYSNNKSKDEISVKKEEFQKKYVQTQTNSPVKVRKINNNENTPNIMNFPESTNIQKLLEVRKSLNGYLQTKYNNDKIYTINEDQDPNMKTENNNQCVAVTENNINARENLFENKLNNKNLKVINYDEPNNMSSYQKSMNYLVENKKERNPYSEIDKYDNMIESDKPFNYFSKYNYNSANPNYQLINDNFCKNDYVPRAYQMKTEINEINPNLYYRKDNKFNNNTSINYLEELKNNKNDEFNGYPSNIKFEQNYFIDNLKKNQSLQVPPEQELLHKSIENKKNLRINTKPFPTGNNTTISNLTTIQKFDNNSKSNYTITDSVNNDINNLSNKPMLLSNDLSINNKRKDVLNNFKTYLTEFESKNTTDTSPMSIDPSRKLKDDETVFKKEYERNLQNLELVNERLKLNEESKRYIFSKINPYNNYDQVPNVEIGKNGNKIRS